MKKILLIALLLIPVIAFSQNTTKSIDGFLGIKFGTSRAAVLAAVKAKGGKLAESSEADGLAFTNVHLGQREAAIFIVRFVDGKAYRAEFTFEPEDDYHAIEYYNGLVNDVNEIYGKGQSTKKFTSSFVEGDGHEVGALLIGAASIYTIWQSANNNLINASIDKDEEDGSTSLEISLIYQDDALNNIYESKQKASSKSDY